MIHLMSNESNKASESPFDIFKATSGFIHKIRNLKVFKVFVGRHQLEVCYVVGYTPACFLW